jgi:hypothetical protein
MNSMTGAASALFLWAGIQFFSTGILLHDFAQNCFLALLVGFVGLSIQESIKALGYSQSSVAQTLVRRDEREAERLAEEHRQKVFDRKYGPNSPRP